MPFNIKEEYLIATEDELGAPLPKSYRDKMLKSNGGAVATQSDHWDLHPIFDKSDKKRLRRTCNHILRETASMKDWSGWPENAIAIASNGSGDALVFQQVHGRIEDAILVWHHETGKTEVVATDFSELKTVR